MYYYLTELWIQTFIRYYHLLGKRILFSKIPFPNKIKLNKELLCINLAITNEMTIQNTDNSKSTTN